jgi:hypothetical protein
MRSESRKEARKSIKTVKGFQLFLAIRFSVIVFLRGIELKAGLG